MEQKRILDGAVKIFEEGLNGKDRTTYALQ